MPPNNRLPLAARGMSGRTRYGARAPQLTRSVRRIHEDWR